MTDHRRPRIKASDYRHLLARPGAAEDAPHRRALDAYGRALGTRGDPGAIPKAGSPAAKAVALYRRLTGQVTK